MMVIGIVGSKGSGKETAARFIANKFGGQTHSHSEIYTDVLSVLDVPHTRMNLIRLVELRKTFGDNVLINALNKKIKEENADVEVITGIRFQNELDNIRSFEHNFVIFLEADPETRYKNQIHRKQYTDDRTMTFEEFLRIENEETEKHIRELKDQADAVVENSGTVNDLYKRLEEIISPILTK